MTGNRKLAAILAADVAGYSRLAGADEDRTLARLRALRSDLIDPTIAAHNGRVIKRTGIETLVEFRTVVEPAADIVREIDAEAQSNTHATRDVGCEVTALQQSSSQFEGTPVRRHHDGF